MALQSSILADVKDYCMVPQEADIYDSELLGRINSSFFTLFELGCSKKPYNVTSVEIEWDDFIADSNTSSSVSFISTIIPDYIKKKVKLDFDPPANSFLVTQLKDQITELESRISYAVDPGWGGIDE